MSSFGELLEKLAEANETIEYYEEALDEADAKLSDAENKLLDAEEELAESEAAQSEMKEGMETMGAKLRQAEHDLERALAAQREEQEKTAALSSQLSKVQEASGAEISRHKETISALREEHKAAIAVSTEEKSSREKSGNELTTAMATIANLQTRLENTTRVVSVLTSQRDAARGDLVSTSSSCQTTVQSMDRANSEIAAKYEAALGELSASRDLLRAETAAKEEAQRTVEEFQGQFASVEALIDDAINRIGCADTFVYQSKLDYISASADEVLALQAELSKIRLESKQEREAKQESGPAVPDVQASVEPVIIEMSDALEAELRSQIKTATAEAARQSAKIKKQKRDMESQSVRAATLMAQVVIREERIKDLEQQLAGEQSRVAELQRTAAHDAVLSRKLDLAIPKISEQQRTIAELEKKLSGRWATLVQTRSDKERAENLLAETAKQLDDAKKQSTFRRIANRIYVLRIDKDTERIASHAAEISRLNGVLGQLQAENLKLMTRRRPLINTPPFAKKHLEAKAALRQEIVTKMTDGIRAGIRVELERSFWAEKRQVLKVEVAREFADRTRAGMGLSPIHVSLSDVGVVTPTTDAPPSSAALPPPRTMRVVATFTVVNTAVLFAVFSLFLFLGL